ncbi:PAB-dependent poly(A)-specific ribonuclease subunit PAN3 [Escovopsis weberi]|uniref:PAN2-PAN3 deadenylation complex subunit PAN3 n=1 Tax=Escovopsis weberi TaxID=150374 RepID=A0A0M8N8N7_ESCWE|nr:PAB-dependent poly(A)-specific ribonuclease subunit PAN3 [Escovopsis weberi]
MATSRYQSPNLQRQVGSPRPKGRENKDTLCRNILIYGHCRYEDQGCSFSHDQNRGSQNEVSKKSFNVDSPSFTPTILQASAKKPTFYSQAVTAPSFTPRGLGAATPAATPDAEPSFNPATIREFTPSFDLSSTQVNINGSAQDGSASYDPFGATNQTLPPTPFNPYAEDHHPMTGGGSTFYPTQGPFAAPTLPLQYHLYAPIGPHREDLMPYHRLTHDFFIPEKLREEFQRKTEASLQVMHNSQLPQLDNYHSLVALDTTHRKNANVFGYPSWVYKATSSKTGNIYCLRRLEGYRLTNEHAIRSVKEWRRIDNAGVVSVHDAFTTRAFGDSSLIFVQDYHPLSRTLAEAHFNSNSNLPGRFNSKLPVTEAVLWGYISQIANALKSIHSNNLAARCIDISKIILTDKNRIRLDACAVLDVVHFEARRPVQELQQEDFVHFGRTMLCLATNTQPLQLSNVSLAMEQMGRTFSVEMRDTIAWLLTPAQPPAVKSIDEFVSGISGHIVAAFDQSLHSSDSLTSELYRELENGRIARLLMKLGVINERHEFEGDRSWSENGERYMLKLFRDYVFHQVDSNGNPVVDIGHMLRCLNKLDAGSEERICLTSRDEQTTFVVSYKELKKQLSSAFGDLQKASKQNRTF